MPLLTPAESAVVLLTVFSAVVVCMPLIIDHIVGGIVEFAGLPKSLQSLVRAAVVALAASGFACAAYLHVVTTPHGADAMHPLFSRLKVEAVPARRKE